MLQAAEKPGNGLGAAARTDYADLSGVRFARTFRTTSLSSSLLGLAVFLNVFTAFVNAEALADKPGCELPPRRPPAVVDKYYDDLIKKYGGAEFMNPAEVRPVAANSEYKLEVRYGDNTVSGCNVHLRSYNGNLVGDTIRVHPGEQLFIRLDNRLSWTIDQHPQDPLPPLCTQHFSFNMTNLHTHGLHTSPLGNGDNVLIEVDPGGSQEYRISVPPDHPAGLFWYHAHFHGATAVQISSGMAGALVVEGGYDEISEIKAAQEKIFVLQQLRYGPDGQLENFQDAFPTGNWRRNITVNGQLVPVIRMRPGEVQRWRFVHAGVEDNINLSLDGHKLYEIAADGIALGRKVPWPGTNPAGGIYPLVLGPGYRTEVLVQAKPLGPGKTREEYFLRDGPLPPSLSIQSAAAAQRLAQESPSGLTASEILDAITGKPGRVIAKVVIEGTPVNMGLPSDDTLKRYIPSSLKPISASEIAGPPQELRFTAGLRLCQPNSDYCPQKCDQVSDTCKQRSLINDRVFNPGRARLLTLDSAYEWHVSSGDNVFAHPFHIHVNPFQVQREEPNTNGTMVTTTVWKDTILLPTDGSTLTLRSRETDFQGIFVLHCHILAHEDTGMMELIKITK